MRHCFIFATMIAALAVVSPSIAGSVSRPVAASTDDEQALLFDDIPSVFTASRHEQPITQAPASVDVITAEQIKRYGWRTVGAMLNSLPGFLNTYDRAYQHVGVRGFAPPGDFNTRILVLIDGHRLNENLQDYAGLGRDFPVDVENIERVEVVRGPGSALYGSSAMFAVVNVFTQRGRDLKGARLAGELASFDSHQGQVSLGDKFANGLEALVSASFFHSDGHRNLHFPGLGTAHELDREQVERLFGKVSWGDLTLSGGFLQRRKFLPAGSAGADFNVPGSYYNDRRSYADLNYQHVFGQDWAVTGRLFWDGYHFDDELKGANGVTNMDIWNGQWFGGEALVSRSFFDDHRLTLGTEYRRNFQKSMFGINDQSTTPWADTRLHNSIYGVYLQDEWRIVDNLRLNAGVRYDYYDNIGGTVNPRLGLVYQPWRDTTWKLLYGTAFRAPSPFEMFYNCCNGDWVGNAALKPENIETYELVWEQRLNSFFDLRLSPFHNRLSNVITMHSDPATQFQNSGNAEAHGIETQLQGHYEAAEGRLSYTWLDSQVDGATAVNAPVHMVKFNLTAPVVADKVFAGLEVQFVSDRTAVAANTRAQAYSVSNLTLSTQRWLPGVEVIGGIYNLFDERFVDPSAPNQIPHLIPQDGRNFRIRLSYEF